MTTGCFVIKHPVFAFFWCKWKGFSLKEMFPESTNRELMVRSKSTASLYFAMFSRKLITARLNSPSFCKFYFPNPFTFDYNMPQEGDREKHLLPLCHQPCGLGRKDWACLNIYRCHSFRLMFGFGQAITAGCRQKEQVAHLGKASLSVLQL